MLENLSESIRLSCHFHHAVTHISHFTLPIRMKISLKQILKNVLSKFKFAGALCESLLW